MIWFQAYLMIGMACWAWAAAGWTIETFRGLPQISMSQAAISLVISVVLWPVPVCLWLWMWWHRNYQRQRK